ncbi:hypothetical protein ACIREM_42365 [Streptomyces shenzhenensis]|uniref:hypothetical protein n=1 Tax=Streptomyces shenzhenensis TaxID=943815 RepID=UPI003804FA4D
MRVRATVVTTALLLATLSACSGDDAGKSDTAAKRTSAASPSGTPSDKNVDCTDENLSQADWMAYCAEEAGADGDGGKLTGLKFGESYTWPDGLKVTVVGAKEWRKFTEEDFATDDPKATEFRILLKITNGGKGPVKLDDLSTFIDGATNGGRASTTEFVTDSQPLTGRIAPGVTVTKTDDNALETRYGRKIVVTVQRSSEDLTFDFPEFDGEIEG